MTAAFADRHVLYDARWLGSHGIGRFCGELLKRVPNLRPLSAPLRPFHPLDPLWTSALTLPRNVRAYFTPGFNAPWVCRVPLLLTVHDLNYVHFPDNSDPLRRLYFERLVRPACRSAHRVLTVSEFSRRQIVDWADIDEQRVVNVSGGVDASFEPRGARADLDFPYLLAMSNGRPHKNTPRLIQAFARSGIDSTVKLVIAGKLEPAARELIATLGIFRSVHVIEHVPEAKLPDLYRGALAFCMPSLYEGFGLPVIEAMACGIPVLASTATSLPEVAGDAAVLIEPSDTDAMAHALRRVVWDDALRKTLVARGLTRSARFSWDETAARVQGLLDELP